MRKRGRLCALILAAGALVGRTQAAASPEFTLRLAPMPGIGHLVPELARGLGYFRQAGIHVKIINVMNYRPDDFYSTELLNDGTIDAEICWYQRVVFGIGNGQPARAVFLIDDSPHLTIAVANRLRGKIRSAADFKGRVIADSAGFSTRHYLTDFIMARAGLPADSYTPAPANLSADPALLIAALQAGQVDIVASMEPLTSRLLAAHLVTPLYDLRTAAGTRVALGDVWPARSLYLAPSYIKAHPERVQRLVDVFVRTMRYINSHTAAQIVAKLPSAYFAPDVGNDSWAAYKQAKTEEIARAQLGFTRDDYSIPPSAAKLAVDVLLHTPFDDSPEGRYRRAAARSGKVRPEMTYDNRFVEKAMKAYP
ncbi:MAG: ABC transporter substrate-binding protein [Gammaproteobacteria bacterium]|nr:ABC transporter substrate-binding protein [Gammaproteobacteria bacterium]